MRHNLLIAGVFAMTVAGCGGEAAGPANIALSADDPTANAVAVDSGPCADDGDRLPITGICAGRAVNYLNVADGGLPEAPEGCEWVVQETRFERDVLLYRATKCGAKTTRLAFAPGAGLAELSYESVALGDPDGLMKGEVVARVAGLDRRDKLATLLGIARDAITDPAERARCSVRNAALEGWPADALVVDVNAAEAAKAPPDEPRAACGPFGFNGDEASYWRVFQGRSWFFQLGQDVQQIDPGSFTLLAKGADGGWTQAK